MMKVERNLDRSMRSLGLRVSFVVSESKTKLFWDFQEVFCVFRYLQSQIIYNLYTTKAKCLALQMRESPALLRSARLMTK